MIHTQPSQTATAGQALAIQPVVYEEDQFGNIEIERQQHHGDGCELAAAPERSRA